MKKCFIVSLWLILSMKQLNARLISVTSVRELEDRTFCSEIAIVFFYCFDKKMLSKHVYTCTKEYRHMIQEVARYKRYRYAQMPFIAVDLSCNQGNDFIRNYTIKPQLPTALIIKRGKRTACARLDGFVSEMALKNFIESKVGCEVDRLIDERQEYDRWLAYSCPAWVHDWYFYWPYHYYGFNHPYYWHDGFHIPCGF